MFRAVVALAVVVVVVACSWVGVRYVRSATEPTPEPWFGGYVDVTAVPSVEFESLSGAGAANVVLAFVVASSGDGSSDGAPTCVPSWGGAYTLDQADDELDLDRRIAQVSVGHRTPMVSFGGQANSELALACQDVGALTDAYRQVIDRYDVSSIDLDLEGDGLTDAAARARRAQAVASVQSGVREDGKDLAVWVTLPADRNGLTNDGLTAVRELLDAGVELSGINLMTMDFGVPSATTSASALVEESLEHTHGQLQRLLLSGGEVPASAQVWAMMGATVMIGQNDIQGESFSVTDAGVTAKFADEKQLGRLSLWSLNRDRACSSNVSAAGAVSDSCSGVDQDDGAFATALAAGRSGSADSVPGTVVSSSTGVSAADSDTSGRTGEAGSDASADDPATSPYAIWNASTTYAAGTKIVWHRNVYSALWTNQDEQPDLEAPDGTAAWRLVGPVLPGETRRVQPTLPADTYADWNADTVYRAGDRVMLEGVAYEARWWTQGDSPEAASASSDASPWRTLTDDEITAVLSEGS